MEKSSKFSNLSGIAVIATGFLAIVGASLIYFDIGISISEIHISYAELINQTANPDSLLIKLKLPSWISFNNASPISSFGTLEGSCLNIAVISLLDFNEYLFSQEKSVFLVKYLSNFISLLGNLTTHIALF